MAEEYVSKASVLAALEWRWAGKGAIDAVKAIRAADVVPVVRCKDCEHKDRESGFCHGRGWPMQLVPDDGFCDKGKER